MEFNRFGNLDGGIVEINNIEEIYSFFVTNFPESITRERNYNGMISFFEFLNNVGLGNYIKKYWIDGSFTTNKIDPNDIDLILILDASPDVVSALEEWIDTHWNIIRAKGEELFCDVYPLFDVNSIDPNDRQAVQAADYQRKYWMGQFGFDRNEKPKGIIELENELKGADCDAN